MRRLLTAIGLGLVLWQGIAGAADPRPIRVMSFNIRYGTANDGDDHWTKRREFLFDTIRAFDPDLLGTQETQSSQRDELQAAFESHAAIGVGRDDGRESGEMTAVLIRNERFEPIEQGHFWLSETPDVPGSRSWDAAITRMVTWVRLRDRGGDNGELWLFNTHFDHIGVEARANSAALLRREVARRVGGRPAIITGDFNQGEGSRPYEALFGPREDGLTLIDVYRAAHPDRRPDEGTFNGFRPDAVRGDRIDWIACTPHFRVVSCEIDRTMKDGRVPSDHFPVNAVLELVPMEAAAE
ncbi:MAG: endonuclease/exonuclease/phosphatase family protein [Planctomyces sp.]|nr:endonuclease/exonuclease/phosphatase family protein [Planctomyces sp.]